MKILIKNKLPQSRLNHLILLLIADTYVILGYMFSATVMNCFNILMQMIFLTLAVKI